MTSKLINKSHSNWRKHKKYQYKFLLEKINQRWLEYHRSYDVHYEHFGTDVSNQDDYYYLKQIEKRLLTLTQWLEKIKKKYNYA